MKKSGTSANAVSPPSGSGLVAGLGESFTLDMNSGQGTFSLPFELPGGVAGFKPAIKLEYRSSNHNGPFGMGWALQQRKIERRLDFGIPETVVEQLFLDSGVELRLASDGHYHPVRETSFSRYARIDDHWTVQEKNGERYFFGVNGDARISDPHHPDRIQSWLLERHEDVNGNTITYHYTHHNGYPYLAEIRYAKYIVRFNYEARPDELIDGRAGFVRQITQRCQSITLALAVPHRLVRTLAFTYDDVNGISQMVSAQLTGHGDGIADVVKNPVSFIYSQFDPHSFRTKWVEGHKGDPTPPSLDDFEATAVSLDDLPLPGILGNYGGRHVYWPSDGRGGWDYPRVHRHMPFANSFAAEGVQFIDMDGTGSADMLVGVGDNPLNGYYRNTGSDGFTDFVAYPRQARVMPPFATGRVRLADLNGDGNVDALYSTRRGLVAFRNHDRAGWVQTAITPNEAEADFADPLTFLADMTGDGMADIVRVRSGKVEYWLNLGHGRFDAGRVMDASPRLSDISRIPDQVILTDVTGDGCSDLVRITADSIQLYPNNNGHGFSAPITYPTIPTPIPGTAHMLDLEGRGSADILYNSLRGGKTGHVHISWPHQTPAHMVRQIDNGAGLVSQFEYTSLVQMALQDRDQGRPWSTYMPFPIWVVSGTRETDQGRGLSTEVHYRYHDGHFDALFRRFQGFGEVDKIEVGDDSRADVLTRHSFLTNQTAVPGHSREHAHLERLLSRVEVYCLDGSAEEPRALRVEQTDYSLINLETLPDGEKRIFVGVSRNSNHFSERSLDERVEERAFEYDAFGNVILETTRGYGTQGGAPVTEKQITTHIEYASDAAQRIFKPSCIVKRNSAGEIVTEVRKHYDGQPLGQLSHGLLTREQHLVLDKASYDTYYAGMNTAALGYLEQPDTDGNPAVFALEIVKTYTAEGSVATETTGDGSSATKVYDSDALHIIEETANGKSTQRSNDPVTGKPLELVSTSGATIYSRYDALGRITDFAANGDTLANPTRRIGYDDTSIPNARFTSYKVNASTRSNTVLYYDGQGKELQKRVERAPGEVVVSEWRALNPWRQTKAEFEPTLDTTLDYAIPATAGRPARRVFFDGVGRPQRAENYNGGVSSSKFSAFEISLRDANDNDSSHLAFNTPRREQVDVWNHRTAVIESGSGGTPVTTRFTIGLFGELLAVKDDQGTVCTYGYDRRGNLLTVDHRDTGARQQWYNCRNDIVRTLDNSNNDVTVTRDPERRVTEVRLTGNIVEQFNYDDITPESDGKLTQAQYAAGSQQFEYNARGFLSQHTTTIDGQDLTLGYQYNDMGKQTAVIYPDGTTITREHSLNGLVQSIDGIIDNITYDARNLPTLIRFANGVEHSIIYEPGVGHVRSQHTVGPGGQVLENLAFSYDDLMQITGRQDSAPGAQQTSTYEHDPLNQLARVTGSDSSGNFTLDYSYSNGYNLAQLGETGALLGYQDAARPDRLTDITPAAAPVFNVGYDANGNLAGLPGRQLSYNFKNQLEEVTLENGAVVRYDYDYRGNRIRRRSTHNGATTETLFLGRLVELRGGQFTNFVIFNRRRIALLRNGQTRWIHVDPMGNANFFSDEAGNKIAQISYHAFGNERHRNGNPPLRSFALHDFDNDTGLIYMGHRWYAPEIGRFITPDPLYLYQPERSDGDPVKLRLYTYVGNRPLDNVDPEGLSFWSVVGAIVGVIVGIIIAIAVVAAFAVGIGWGLLAIAGVIGLMTISYVIAHNEQGNGWGEFFRGFMIGLNAGMNAAFLAMMGPVGAVIGVFVGVVIFLGSIDSIASSEIYQGILGWSNFLMPMSWLVVGLGAIMWILNGLGHLIFWEIPNLWGGGIQFFRITGFQIDWSTGMLATRGGWIANANTIDTAYNMGNFAYVDNNSTGWHLDHEAGHNLNLAVFGSIFHFIGFIHEMGTGAGAGAFSEVLADSNDGGPGMWN